MREQAWTYRIRKVIWDHLTSFERKFQSQWWQLVNFTDDQISNHISASVLTLCNAIAYTIYPSTVLGIYSDNVVLYPTEC